MSLCKQDRLALELIFKHDEAINTEIISMMDKAQAIEREETGVGFYSKIKLGRPLSSMPEVKLKQFDFEHPSFEFGGSFMCWFISCSEIEVEGVAFGGVDWVNCNDISLFREM